MPCPYTNAYCVKAEIANKLSGCTKIVEKPHHHMFCGSDSLTQLDTKDYAHLGSVTCGKHGVDIDDQLATYNTCSGVKIFTSSSNGDLPDPSEFPKVEA